MFQRYWQKCQFFGKMSPIWCPGGSTSRPPIKLKFLRVNKDTITELFPGTPYFISKNRYFRPTLLNNIALYFKPPFASKWVPSTSSKTQSLHLLAGFYQILYIDEASEKKHHKLNKVLFWTCIQLKMGLLHHLQILTYTIIIISWPIFIKFYTWLKF